eukprot:CAMPEP_0114157660 /NCGR_PEP_ID=MMETSP0043_2-20121206/26744_1 /TAXON_ID=464988 /ORGANISM="Hemiselmis andersenii, Strain CCMP644" /LENGTH=36 /DNA_ID= /DNA_START= /DNA_END= /DNA_ORIENTATION=
MKKKNVSPVVRNSSLSLSAALPAPSSSPPSAEDGSG